MTCGEIYEICKAQKDLKLQEYKQKIRMNYDLAVMVSSFVCLGLDGKKPTELEKIYPSLFGDADTREQENKRDALIKDMWLDFAERHNKRRAKT